MQLINGCIPSLSDIKFSIRRGARLPWDKRDEWQKDAFDYRVTLRFGRRQMSLDFFTGKGWMKEPQLNDVLSCLFSDVFYDGMDFEEFCGELGYDTDSRRAHSVWKAATRQAVKFKDLLGDDFEALQAEWEAKENR